MDSTREVTAYAKTGGRGIILKGPGKTAKARLAEQLARLMICKKNGAEDCNCASCRSFFDGTNPDIDRFGKDAGARTLGINVVREHLRLTTNPAVGKRRCVIVSDFGLMTEEAQNAILKISEDYPDRLAIIGLYDSGRLLQTVKSRMAVFEFGPQPLDTFRISAAEASPVKNGLVSADDLYIITGGYAKKEVDVVRYKAVLTAIRQKNAVNLLKALNMWLEGDKNDFFQTHPTEAPDMVAFMSRVFWENVNANPMRTAEIVRYCSDEEEKIRRASYGKLEWCAFVFHLIMLMR